MLARWNRYWFGDEVRYDPMGLVRIAAVIFCLRKLFDRDFRALHNALALPPELVAPNLGLRLSPLPYPLPAEWVDPFHTAMIVVGLLALVGLFTRPALLLLASGALYLAAGYAALNDFDHQQVLTLSLLWILVVYPSGASFSVDAALRWWRVGRRENRPGSEIFSLQRRNSWGLRLALATLALVYVTAGVSKIRYSEGAWLNGETLAFYLTREDGRQVYLAATWEEAVGEDWKSPISLVDHSYGYGTRSTSELLGGVPLVVGLLSITTVVLELAAPLLLAPPLVSAAFIAAVLAMHTAISLTMGIGFAEYRAYLLLFVDWPALIAAARSFGARRRSRGESGRPRD